MEGRLVTWGNSLPDDEQGCGRAAMDKNGLNNAHLHSAAEKGDFHIQMFSLNARKY